MAKLFLHPDGSGRCLLVNGDGTTYTLPDEGKLVATEEWEGKKVKSRDVALYLAGDKRIEVY